MMEPTEGYRWVKAGDPICYSDPYQENGVIVGTIASMALQWAEGGPYGCDAYEGRGYLKALTKEELGK